MFNAIRSTGRPHARCYWASAESDQSPEAYGIRAHSIYARLCHRQPVPLAQPLRPVPLQRAEDGRQLRATWRSGNFVDSQLAAVLQRPSGYHRTGAANKPHISGNAGFEMRPFRRLRIVESWSTDRFHDAAYAHIAAIPAHRFRTPRRRPRDAHGRTSQVVNYNRTQTDLFFDADLAHHPARRLPLRVGRRHGAGAPRSANPDSSNRASSTSKVGHRGIHLSGPSRRLRSTASTKAARATTSTSAPA